MTRIFLFSLINFTNITNILIFPHKLHRFFHYAQDFFDLATERTHEPHDLTHKKSAHLIYKVCAFRIQWIYQ